MLNSIVSRYAAESGGARAVVDGDGALTFAELARAMACFEAELAGLGAAECFAVILPQRAEALALLAACAACGKHTLIISETQGRARATRFARELGADFLLRFEDGALQPERLTTAGRDVASAAAEPRVWLLTSGTSGSPKCIQHTFSTLAASAKVREHLRGRRWLLGYPIAQFAGLQVLIQCLVNGGTLVIPRDFAPPTCLRALIEKEVEYLTCTPSSARLMLSAATPAELSRARVRHVTLGGEAADQRILSDLERAFPTAKITATYASTELGLILSSSDGKAGFALSELTNEAVKIVDGQLHVRRSGRSMLSGTEGVGGQEEFLPTGDLVELRGDRLYVVGRADDVFNVGGFKVVPSVVEEVIRSISGVMEAAVGPQRNSVLGNLVKARVRLREGSDRTQTLGAIDQQCSASLPYYMVPRLVEVVDRIELNGSQKVTRGVQS